MATATTLILRFAGVLLDIRNERNVVRSYVAEVLMVFQGYYFLKRVEAKVFKNSYLTFFVEFCGMPISTLYTRRIPFDVYIQFLGI